MPLYITGSGGDADLSNYVTNSELADQLATLGAKNVIFQHGAPSNVSDYSVGDFVVDVDDNMHVYEIGS